jgi:hypothetical protein
MSVAPGRIVRTLDITAPRPRSVARLAPETLAHRVTVLDLLKRSHQDPLGEAG